MQLTDRAPLCYATRIVLASRLPHRPLSWVSAWVLVVLLGTMLTGWAHAAEHAGETRSDDCSACAWIQHSPAALSAAPAEAAATGARPAPDAAPALSPARVVAAAPTSRGPPSA